MSQYPHPLKPLETAHVLFMDIVQFSTHFTYEQVLLRERLNEVVTSTSDYLRYEDSLQLISRSTGDGMALVFFGDAEAPARCALEVCRALKSHPEIKLRMGIHTGPVMRISSFDGTEDVTGKGMNMAQRVMDCGEAGHILVSKAAAADLSELPGWKERLLDLGEVVVKHDDRIHLFNLYDEECGNSSLSTKLSKQAVIPAVADWREPAFVGSPEGVNPAIAPYPGPQPFTPTMTDKLFGRRRETEELLKLLSEFRLVVVFATSGAGKSSLLNTRVRERLALQGFEVLIDARVGGTLPEEVNTSEIRNIFTYSVIYSLSQKARPNPLCRLGDYLRTLPRKPGSQGRVLILDQFEELFTQYPMRHEDRAGFFEDLIAAMNDDPTLGVILAVRKEYLPDIEQLAEQLPDAPPMRRFLLKCMERANALEAIKAPIAMYATFAEGVAEEIVDQLNTIRVSGRGGPPVFKRGEFIEMVHLQIVCERLWSSLPEGVKQIEMEHLERAAGGGKTFKEFVVNALDWFYDSTVENVASSSETREHGGYSPELIRLGCIKFVTPELTRTMVRRRANGRVGRLPGWIVKQLVKYHLLRSEQRGGELWYELAHERLAEPVGRWMHSKANSMPHTADLLEKVLGKALEENGGNLDGYFAKHNDILAQCQPFRRRAGLFEDEAEFVFRASLVNGELKQMYRWSRRLRKDYPQVRLKVLRDALSEGPAEVRRHAAVLLGLKGDQDVADDLAAMLTRLALSDNDSGVRRAAAVTLAQLDRPKAYDDLIGGLHDPATRAGAEAALSQIRVAADQRVNAPYSEDRFSRLGWAHRWRIRRRTWRQRLREEAPALPFIVIPAAIFAAVSAAAFKWLPGYYGWALTQGTPSAGMGAFQGAAAGFIWAGFIVLGLTIYNVAFRHEYVRKSYLRPFPAIVTGAVSGFVSTLLIIWVVIGVFEMKSLVEIGWVSHAEVKRYSREFWHYLFIETRFGLTYLITGTGLGVGMALTTNGLLASGQWLAFLKKQKQLVGFMQTDILLRGITCILVRHAWPLPVVLLFAGLLAYSVVPEGVTGTENLRPGNKDLAKGLIGDCLTQVIGAFFGLVGMGFGIVSVTWGFRLESRASRGAST